MKNVVTVKKMNRTSLDNVVLAFFFLYVITIHVELISTQINSILQNIFMISFIGLSSLRKHFRFNIKPFVIQYGIFVLYAGLSLFWTINFDNSFSLIRIFIKILVFLFFALNYFDSFEKIKVAFKLIYYALIAGILYVIISSPWSDWEMQRIGKDFGIDTVRLSVRASIVTFLSFYFLNENKNKSKKIIYTVILILFFINTLLTGKRTGLIFSIVSIFLYLFMVNKSNLKRIKTLIVFGLAIIFVWFAIMNVEVLYDTIGIRVENFIKTFFEGERNDASTLQRTQLLNHAIDLFRMNPIFGNGLNANRSYLNQIGFIHVTYAHNNFLEIGNGLGLIGCCLYYSIYLFPLIIGFKFVNHYKGYWHIALYTIIISLLLCDFVQVVYESYFEILLLAFLNTSFFALYNENSNVYQQRGLI